MNAKIAIENKAVKRGLAAMPIGKGGWEQFFWVEHFALFSLWLAATLTIITGWDYLRTGLRHMD